jgi:hypothetical protein
MISATERTWPGYKSSRPNTSWMYWKTVPSALPVWSRSATWQSPHADVSLLFLWFNQDGYCLGYSRLSRRKCGNLWIDSTFHSTDSSTREYLVKVIKSTLLYMIAESLLTVHLDCLLLVRVSGWIWMHSLHRCCRSFKTCDSGIDDHQRQQLRETFPHFSRSCMNASGPVKGRSGCA